MNILFIHQNFPAQYRHIALHYARQGGHRLVAIAKSTAGRVRGVEHALYKIGRKPRVSRNPYVQDFEAKVHHGDAALRMAKSIKAHGFTPDVILSHPGWGEDLFIKDVFPDAPRLAYAEFYYHAHGADVNFDPEISPGPVDEARIRARNAAQLLSMESAVWLVSPTEWQRRQYPSILQPKISVVHDGIDVDRVTPAGNVGITLASGPKLTAADEVVTYVARNLEPYRGFHQFMRAARLILERRPNARILVVGGDQVSYGRRPAQGITWREHLIAEAPIDLARIHFLGRVSYDAYLQVLRVSRAHVYLTVPFVLSWSMLEAMAAECLVIGSATPPVTEVIEDGRNGLLVDFFSPEDIAARVCEALARPEKFDPIRQAARRTVVDRYALDRLLPRQYKLVEAVAAGALPPNLAGTEAP